jgi:2-methylisocitrate lyase-like PEP mutase family enzyme
LRLEGGWARAHHPRQALRELLAVPQLIVAPGVYDGLSARIVEEAGFRAVYLSGGAVARSAGVPDLGLLSLTEVITRTCEVVDSVELPVIADADAGYGGNLNVARTVREFERSGAAAIHIEDQPIPKRCGHYARHSTRGAILTS